MTFDMELVGKIGSMALIRETENDMDYNVFSRLGAQLQPGMVWVSSGGCFVHVQKQAASRIASSRHMIGFGRICKRNRPPHFQRV